MKARKAQKRKSAMAVFEHITVPSPPTHYLMLVGLARLVGLQSSKQIKPPIQAPTTALTIAQSTASGAQDLHCQ